MKGPHAGAPIGRVLAEESRVIRTLSTLRADLQASIPRVRRKRSWREAEKAMTIAHLREQIEDLSIAIAICKEHQ